MALQSSVLVIGGGLNGLTMAALLSRLGVDCAVAERHEKTSIQYKFAGISPRSMEIFRALGLEKEIRAGRTGDQQGGDIVRGRNMSDPELAWQGAAWPDTGAISPTPPATCDQHVLEPILKRCAERQGAVMRFGRECTGLAQHPDGVEARLVNPANGQDEEISARYVIIADGAGGSMREALGIGAYGPGPLQHWMNIIFDTDMFDEIDGRRFTSFFVTDLNATLTPRPGGRWLLALQYFPERGESPGDFDADRTRELVCAAAGREVRAELVDARAWTVAAQVADRFSEGRAFLIGDCAHLMPPTGAFGGNTGIHDAHNLAWKLALVLRDQASPALLDSYDQERRPVVEATLAQALARLQTWFRDPAGRLPPPVDIVDDYDVVFGQVYRAGALIGEAAEPDCPFAPAAELSGKPGTRLPHVQLSEPGSSILDLLGPRPLLLASHPEWISAARRLAAAGAPLDHVAPDADWHVRAGITEDGALMVRPDGFVAWRSKGKAAVQPESLENVLETVLASGDKHGVGAPELTGAEADR